MVSSRGKSKGCFATFAEMKTRMYIALKMPDRSKDSMFKALQQLTGTLPKEAFKSFTSDRGKEFACYSDVEKSMKIDTKLRPQNTRYWLVTGDSYHASSFTWFKNHVCVAHT